jgi:hypothetical protein
VIGDLEMDELVIFDWRFSISHFLATDAACEERKSQITNIEITNHFLICDHLRQSAARPLHLR